MNDAQVRHAKAMARKIREHAQAIVNEMSLLESVSPYDMAGVPLNNIVRRFTHDTGYGVQDRMEAIESIIREMLPDLESQ